MPFYPLSLYRSFPPLPPLPFVPLPPLTFIVCFCSLLAVVLSIPNSLLPILPSLIFSFFSVSSRFLILLYSAIKCGHSACLYCTIVSNRTEIVQCSDGYFRQFTTIITRLLPVLTQSRNLRIHLSLPSLTCCFVVASSWASPSNRPSFILMHFYSHWLWLQKMMQLSAFS